MKWIIDYIIGTIESIGVFYSGGTGDVEYFVIIFTEYKRIYFKVPIDMVMKNGIYELSTGAFTPQMLDSLKGRRASVRVSQEKLGKNDWYIVEEIDLLK